MSAGHQVNYVDWTQLEQRINRFVKSRGLPDRETGFLHAVLDLMFGLSADQIETAITDGGNDRGVDAIYIERTVPEPVVHMFQNKLRQQFESCTKNFPSREIDKLLSFLNDLLTKKKGFLESCNPLLYEKVREIYEVLEGSNPRFIIHLCSNGMPLLESHKKRLDEALATYQTFISQEHHLADFSRLLVSSVRPRLTRRIKLVDRPGPDHSDIGIRGFVGTVTVEELVKLVVHPQLKDRADPAAFFDNFRVFLGFENEFNEIIFKSALSGENQKFWFLNNGITIVCDKYSYQSGMIDPIVTLENFQIVNGCQTSHVLFEAFRTMADKVKNVQILVRVYETNDSELSGRIAEATNTQTRVKSRDLRANDMMQRKIESILFSRNFFYERKEEQFVGKPNHSRVDAFKFGQVLVAWFNEEPEKAKSQSNRIFGEDYKYIFSASLDVPEALNAFLLLSEFEEFGANLAKSIDKSSTKKMIKSLMTYGKFHLLYCAKLIMEKEKLKFPLDADDIVRIFNASGEAIAAAVDSMGNISLYEVFRSHSTKRYISKIVYPEATSGELFRQASKSELKPSKRP